MDIVKSLNLDKLINNSELLAVKPAGSMLRKIAHANSDFDMVCLVRENRHELLTNKLISKQVINTVNGINIDVKVIDLRSFYKQIMNQSPEYYELLLADNIFINDYAKNNPYNMLNSETQNHFNFVNLTKMISVVKGMSSNLLRQINKYETDSKRLRKLLKQIDTVEHYADMVGFLQWFEAVDLNSLSVRRKYHDFYHSEDAIDNTLISDAKSELKKIIKTDYGALNDKLSKQSACQDYVSRVFELSLIG